MKKVILFAHSAQGVLLVTDEELLKENDAVIGRTVVDQLKKSHPHLINPLRLDEYEEIHVDRNDPELRITVTGYDGLLYIDVEVHSVMELVEKDKTNPINFDQVVGIF